MKFVARIAMMSLAAILSAHFLPGIEMEDFTTAVIFALIFSFLNTFLKPILILFTLPITVVTLGLFLLVINALIIMLADRLIEGLYVSGFWWALAFSLLMSFIMSIFNAIDKKEANQKTNIRIE
jgi:putative membrane protein